MAEINVTPMVDVMLVLLVIFIMSARCLPCDQTRPASAKAAPAEEKPQTVTITVEPAGKLFWNDAPLKQCRLRQIGLHRRPEPQPDLLIRRQGTRYEVLAEIMSRRRDRVGQDRFSSPRPRTMTTPDAKAVSTVKTQRRTAGRDWDAFHTESQRAFGFPAFYGATSAWIDCLSYLRDDDGMSPSASRTANPDHCAVPQRPGAQRFPELIEELQFCVRMINERYDDYGEKPALQLLLL